MMCIPGDEGLTSRGKRFFNGEAETWPMDKLIQES
jgi:hypothetical protein